MADKVRDVTFRHRVVVEWETRHMTGYNGDIDWLVKEAQQERARYYPILHRYTGQNREPERDSVVPTVLEKTSTIVANLEGT